MGSCTEWTLSAWRESHSHFHWLKMKCRSSWTKDHSHREMGLPSLQSKKPVWKYLRFWSVHQHDWGKFRFWKCQLQSIIWSCAFSVLTLSPTNAQRERERESLLTTFHGMGHYFISLFCIFAGISIFSYVVYVYTGYVPHIALLS